MYLLHIVLYVFIALMKSGNIFLSAYQLREELHGYGQQPERAFDFELTDPF